jgi:hypothetical protein
MDISAAACGKRGPGHEHMEAQNLFSSGIGFLDWIKCHALVGVSAVVRKFNDRNLYFSTV